MLLLKLLVDIACNSIRCQLKTKKRGKRGQIMHTVAPIFTHYKNESPTLLFFQIEKKLDHFHHPIYKTIPKTVFGPCLQSELENKSQDKSNSVKKSGCLLLTNIYYMAKNDQNSELEKQENVHINHLLKKY